MLPNNNPTAYDLQQDYIHDAIAKMDTNNIYLVDKTKGRGNVQVNVSRLCPTLAIIFKAMLICALDKRAQKLTVEFNDCTAYTTITYPENKQ